jgi:hypothetical protein
MYILAFAYGASLYNFGRGSLSISFSAQLRLDVFRAFLLVVALCNFLWEWWACDDIASYLAKRLNTKTFSDLTDKQE